MITVPYVCLHHLAGFWCRALYDYEGTNEEELSFQEGALIRVVRKDENGIDDGWWEGELNGKCGVFPSLVVEELVDDSEVRDFLFLLLLSNSVFILLSLHPDILRALSLSEFSCSVSIILGFTLL